MCGWYGLNGALDEVAPDYVINEVSVEDYHVIYEY